MKNTNSFVAMATVAALALVGCKKSDEDYRVRIGSYNGLRVTASYRNDTGKHVRIDYFNPETQINEFISATEEFEFKGKFARINRHNVSEGSPLESILDEKSLQEAYATATILKRE